MYCENCGKKLKNNNKFCEKCGHKVEDESINLNKNSVLNNIKIISILGLITSIFGTKGLLLAITGIYENYQYKKVHGKNTNYLIINIITIVVSIFMFVLSIFVGIILAAIQIGLINNNKIIGNYNCMNYNHLIYSSLSYDVNATFNRNGTFIWSKWNKNNHFSGTYDKDNYLKGTYELYNKGKNIKMNINKYVINGKSIESSKDVNASIIYSSNKDSFTLYINSSKYYCTKVK